MFIMASSGQRGGLVLTWLTLQSLERREQVTDQLHLYIFYYYTIFLIQKFLFNIFLLFKIVACLAAKGAISLLFKLFILPICIKNYRLKYIEIIDCIIFSILRKCMTS